MNGTESASPTKIVITISPPDQIKITDFGRLFTGAVSFLLLAAFILAFFYLILGGISWLTSGGDKGNIEAARNKILAAVIGLIIVASTWALFTLVGGALGYNILGGFEVPKLYNEASGSASLDNRISTPSATLHPLYSLTPTITPNSTLETPTPTQQFILPKTGI